MDVLKKFDTGFAQIPNVVLCDPNLSERAKGVYAYLVSKPDGWEFRKEVISRELKCSKNVFRTIVAELTTAKYVIPHQTTQPDGKFGPMVYEFVNPITVDGKTPCRDFYRIGENRYTVAEEKERTKEKEDYTSNTDNPPIVPPKGDDDFEQVWQAYKPTLRRDGKPCPKDSKAQAKVVYQALLKKHSAEEILTATKRYIEDCNTSLDYEGNPRYTMHVKTFLGSHTKGLGNEDYFQELLSPKSTEEQQVSFSNPEPFSRLDYLPEMDADKMMAVVHAHTTAWMLANPVWVDRIKRITNELRNRSSLNYHQKSLQMALELAKDIFRYKDSPEVRNSLVDPLFWLSHRSILTEVFIGTRGSGLFYVGYQLARLAEEG